MSIKKSARFTSAVCAFVATILFFLYMVLGLAVDDFIPELRLANLLFGGMVSCGLVLTIIAEFAGSSRLDEPSLQSVLRILATLCFAGAIPLTALSNEISFPHFRSLIAPESFLCLLVAVAVLGRFIAALCVIKEELVALWQHVPKFWT